MGAWPLTLRGTGTVVLGAVLFGVAHAADVPNLVYVSVLLLAAVGLSVASSYLVRRSDDLIRVFAPDVAAVGDTVAVALRLRTRTSLPTTPGTWRDALSAGLDGDAAGVLPPVASALRGGGEPATLRYRVVATRRGVQSAGPLDVVVTDPFGFARRRRTVGQASEVTVTPAVVELAALDDLPGSTGGSQHTATDPLGQGSDNLIPRTYLPGDSMRRIHWRASAHRGDLMVRQEEQETTPEAVVVFDRGVHRYADTAAEAPGDDAGFEVAVTACVSAVARLVREGYRVTVIDAAGVPLCDPVDGDDLVGVEAACVAFAPLTAKGRTPLDELAHVFGGAPTGPLVLVTGTLTDADAGALSRAARFGSLPILLTVGTAAGLAGRVAESGWRVAPLAPGADLARAWAAGVDGGRAHGRG